MNPNWIRCSDCSELTNPEHLKEHEAAKNMGYGALCPECWDVWHEEWDEPGHGPQPRRMQEIGPEEAWEMSQLY